MSPIRLTMDKRHFMWSMCRSIFLSTYDITMGPVDLTVFLNYLLILKSLFRLLNLIIGGMNGSLQICNMILKFFVI